MRSFKRLPDVEMLRRDYGYDDISGRFYRLADGYEGYINNIGYKQICIGNVIYSQHRLAWKMHYGSDPEGLIDHINGNRSDNRIDNLRVVNSFQNNQNRRLSGRNKTGVKNLQWEKARNRWRVCVTANGSIHVRRFKCFGAAARFAAELRSAEHKQYVRSA